MTWFWPKISPLPSNSANRLRAITVSMPAARARTAVSASTCDTNPIAVPSRPVCHAAAASIAPGKFKSTSKSRPFSPASLAGSRMSLTATPKERAAVVIFVAKIKSYANASTGGSSSGMAVLHTEAAEQAMGDEGLGFGVWVATGLVMSDERLSSSRNRRLMQHAFTSASFFTLHPSSFPPPLPCIPGQCRAG